MTRLFVAACVLIGLTASAGAQQVSPTESIDPNDLTISQFDPESAVAPVSIVEGPGVKVGEGTVLRPVFGAETGAVSNVFYTHTDAQGAGVLRLLAQMGVSSLGGARLSTTSTVPGDGEDQGSLVYRASLRASYDFMLSGDNQVTKTGGLGLGASLHALVNPMGTLSFGVDEDFTRLIRAANFETDADLNRDLNAVRLVGLIRPRGRSLSGYLYYTNTLDIFEQSTQHFTDRMGNTFGVHPIWQWLPQTQLYLDLSWGVMTGISSGPKATSYPLATYAGLATLLSIKTTLNLMAGYTNGFYSQGPSFSAPMAGAQIGYRYSPLGRLTVGYQLAYADSINANYYRDHVLVASVQQLFAPFVLMVQPEVHLRQYNGISVAIPQIMGPDTRDDVIIAVTGGLSYTFRNWFAATLNYRFSSVQTNYAYMFNGQVGDPSYTRHELLLGVRVAM